MKLIRNLLLIVLLLVVLIFGLANALAVPLDEIPPPDPSMVISMPDGTDRTLSELVAISRAAEPPPEEPRIQVEQTGRPGDDERIVRIEVQDEAVTQEQLDAIVARAQEGWWNGEPPDGSDLLELAEYKLYHGESEEAAALLRSVPDDHPRYPRAMRRLGWDVYTKTMDDPARGVAFVNASIRSDPLDGNAWQDAYRVYLSGLGLGLD